MHSNRFLLWILETCNKLLPDYKILCKQSFVTFPADCRALGCLFTFSAETHVTFTVQAESWQLSPSSLACYKKPKYFCLCKVKLFLNLCLLTYMKRYTVCLPDFLTFCS